MMHDTIVNQPLIEADRFVLRPLRRSDQGLIIITPAILNWRV